MAAPLLLTDIETKVLTLCVKGADDLRDVVDEMLKGSRYDLNEVIDAFLMLEHRGILTVDPPDLYRKDWEAARKRLDKKLGTTNN